MKSVLKYIINRVSYRLVMAVFAVLIIYFDSVQAASVPATEITEDSLICRASNNVYTQAGAGLTDGVIYAGAYTGIWGTAAQKDTCIGMLANSSFSYGGKNNIQKDYTMVDGGNGIIQVPYGGWNWQYVVTLGYAGYEINFTHYGCENVNYPDLQGDQCHSIPACDASESVFSSASSSDQICVTDGASGLSCGYASVKDGYGANSGNFVPVGYACECADMPGGLCEVGIEPPFPDGSDCAAFGTQTWCASDSSQCEASITESGGSIPCANCGVVNNTYMCAVADAPKAERCQSGSGRAECEGVPDDWCPTGYVCDDLAQSNPDTSDTSNQDQPACSAGDSRPECQGVSDGQPPIKSEETAQLEQTNALLKGIGDKLDQGNQNTNDTNGLLNQLLDHQFNSDDEAEGNAAIEAAKSAASAGFGDALNDRSAEGGLIAKESTLIGTITNSISGKLVPTSTCQDMPLSIPNSNQVMNIPLCDISAYVRPILAWVFMIIGVIYIRREIYGALKEVKA